MNTQAVLIERIYGRPIMSSIHGFFSIGGLVGSGVIAATLALDVPLLATLGTTCALASCCALLSSNILITGYADEEPAEPGETGNAAASRRPWGRIALLAAVSFGLMLAEGTAYDWSALNLVERYDQSEAVGAIAFGAFSATMVVGRFSADTVSARLGPVAVLRLGSAIAMAGMTLVICSPTPVLSVIGWGDIRPRNGRRRTAAIHRGRQRLQPVQWPDHLTGCRVRVRRNAGRTRGDRSGEQLVLPWRRALARCSRNGVRLRGGACGPIACG